MWVDRDGHQEPLAAPVGAWWAYPSISPDGKRVAADRWTDDGRDIYIWDLERAEPQSVDRRSRPGCLPLWSADGSRVFFSSNRAGVAFNLYSRAADGTGEDELVLESHAFAVC